jgi:very-short-patch-repair endonuclease/transposase
MNWSKEELNSLRENYASNTNKELREFIKRSDKAIHFKATQLGLKKNFDTACRSRKHKEINVTKELIEKLYIYDKKSIRTIASELKLGKNTILHYLNKYNILGRSTSEANKLFYTKGGTNWKVGLTKFNDNRIYLATEKMKATKEKQTAQRLKKKETELGDTLSNIINNMYWKRNLTQEKIAKNLGVGRFFVIETMKKKNISKKPNFRVISNLKGKSHSMYGKTWEQFYGKEEADRMRKEYSLRSQKLMIERLKNKKMPFVNTSIEKAVGNEMLKRNIQFISQYNIDNKFLCDFAIPQFKIIIECDGDYWHANPIVYENKLLDKRQRKNVQRDKFKDTYLSKKGWIVIHFFESEIISSTVACVDQIDEQIRKLQNPLDALQKVEQVAE